MLAANRDELHERPADPIEWWADVPAIAGGRDRRAGGTWLAVRRDGRFAAVLNAAGSAPAAGASSRGDLVVDFLAADDPAAGIEQLARRAPCMAGFHFVGGDLHRAWYLSSAAPQPQLLAPGRQACGNHGVAEPGPRIEHAARGFTHAFGHSAVVGALFAVLADETPHGPAPGDIRPAFIRGPVHGTRCSTLLLVGRDGRAGLHERRFAADGSPTGERSIGWRLST